MKQWLMGLFSKEDKSIAFIALAFTLTIFYGIVMIILIIMGVE